MPRRSYKEVQEGISRESEGSTVSRDEPGVDGHGHDWLHDQDHVEPWRAQSTNATDGSNCYNGYQVDAQKKHGSPTEANSSTSHESFDTRLEQSNLCQDNRTNQKNPTHSPTGPEKVAGYKGTGDKADRDNHGNQMNPTNPNYQGKK